MLKILKKMKRVVNKSVTLIARTLNQFSEPELSVKQARLHKN
jgi:hypothetical protein